MLETGKAAYKFIAILQEREIEGPYTKKWWWGVHMVGQNAQR